ncbi:Histone transcription regulator 3, partial [Friedmanniomyces endolithicus]
MSGFKALNIESDDESEIEVDDTKELQIEDALKLYQTALRYHAQGPASFDKAAEAYQELFESEIFRYPESQAELQRIALYGAFTDDEEPWMNEVPVGTIAAKGSFDSGPSTLPQILHLSHKNYAQFRLDHLTARLDTVNVTLQQIVADASEALSHFVDALDKDDTDLDLWRKTAAVGGMLNSKRVARFCLEAVLEGDDEGLNGVLSLPGLEDGLAGEQLRDLIVELDDRLSMLQSPLST